MNDKFFVKKSFLWAASHLLLSLPFFSRAEVDVNISWVKHTDTLQSMSIAPRGTVNDPFGIGTDWGRGLKCVNDECLTVWSLRINDNYYSECPTKTLVPKGTTLDALMPRVNSRMMVPCTFTAYEFKGGEKLCMRLETYGEWVGPNTSSPGFIFVGLGPQSSCSGGGGQGGGLEPPVQAVTCQLYQQSITLQHPTLKASELNGNRKEASISLSCSRNSNINLVMTGLNGAGQLALTGNGSLYSALTLNNVSAQKGITLNNVGNGGVNVSLASVLVSDGKVAAGQYSASAVLKMTIL